jgi:branched-chain amino acid transport system permease protein
VPFWVALFLVPAGLFLVGAALERTLIRRLMPFDPLYNFLLTFGLTLVLQDLVRREYGITSQPYPQPAGLDKPLDLGLFEYPGYQVFVLGIAVVVCAGVWLLITRTRVGMVVRAATERAELTRALGVNVGRWVTPVFAFGVALAGLAGVLAAPMRAVNPLMGADLIIAVFAVVVIGGLGSVFGSVLAGFTIGVASALCNLYLPSLSQTLVFVLMAVVLLWRPQGLYPVTNR